MVQQQIKDGTPARRFIQCGRAAADSVQQKLPERFQAGHPVKKHQCPAAVVKLDLLGIKIRRAAKHFVKQGEILR